MLLHHSDVPYAVAAEKAAKWAREKFENLINTGREQGRALIKYLMDNQPRDSMYPCTALTFTAKDGELAVDNPEHGMMPFHSNAVAQACAKAGIPKLYLNTLLKDGQLDLIAHNFNQRFWQQPRLKDGSKKTYRLRAVGNEVRGMVSDRYPLWDSNLLLAEFLAGVEQYKGVVVSAQATDTKFSVKAVIPILFEPIKHEVMLFGASLRNSDYGDGKYDISGAVARLRCTNLMTTESVFSKIHLSRRLDETIVFSKETYEADTRTLALATKDVVRNYLSPEKVGGYVEAIQVASMKEIDADAVLEGLRGRGKLSKTEVGGVKDVFRSADVENLPPGNTAWRLSNALSFFAQSVETARGLELETVAGAMAGLPTGKA